jgi:hypothetical protein
MILTCTARRDGLQDILGSHENQKKYDRHINVLAILIALDFRDLAVMGYMVVTIQRYRFEHNAGFWLSPAPRRAV